MSESHARDVTCLFRSLLGHLSALLVAEAGLEPARALGPEDFKSAVSTNSTTPPGILVIMESYVDVLKSSTVEVV